ncbi:hypothetical protein [Dickeya zeae]|nr:hypothetical protein [Dickeya zeae]
MPLAKSTSNRAETLSLAGLTGCVGFLAGFLRPLCGQLAVKRLGQYRLRQVNWRSLISVVLGPL